MHFTFCKTHNFLNTTEQRLDGTDGTNKIIMIGLLLIIQNQMPVQTQRARYVLQMTAKYLVNYCTIPEVDINNLDSCSI